MQCPSLVTEGFNKQMILIAMFSLVENSVSFGAYKLVILLSVLIFVEFL